MTDRGIAAPAGGRVSISTLMVPVRKLPVFADLDRKRRHVEYLTAFVARYRLFAQRAAAPAVGHGVDRGPRRFLYLTQRRARMVRLPARTPAALFA